MGASVVNALSEAMEVGSKDVMERCTVSSRYERGKTMYPLKEDGVRSDDSGTTTWFKPDPEIFKESVVFE